MLLPKGALYIIDRLNANGERADVVGGCVRDYLSHKECNDYDITTSATPDRVEEIFCGSRLVKTGIKHGTVTIVLDDGSYEVTTYRQDGEYLDNRHPTAVTFTRELRDDLSRRDFTINAMCYNPRDGFTDMFGGRGDLDHGIIRAVGEPHLRFTEDALRIMRAIRFASTLGFTLDAPTDRAVRDLAHLLCNISRERIYVEWHKLLSGKSAYRILAEYAEVIAVAIPELSGLRLPTEQRFLSADYPTRLLSLFYLTSDSPRESFIAAMRSLKTDNAIRTLGEVVLGHYDASPIATEQDALRLLSVCDKTASDTLVRLGILLGDYDDTALDILASAIGSGRPYKITHLPIDGNDLAALGLRGRQIGDTLSRLLDLVISGECRHTREDLLACAKKIALE